MIDKTRTPEQIAINRAREIGGASRVTAHGHGLYSVLSSDGTKFYRVSVTVKGQYICNCQAGQQGIRCKHKACVFMFRLAKRSLVQVPVTPTPAKAPVPTFDQLFGAVA